MFTLKIAVCDDDSSLCKILQGILKQIEKENTLSFDIEIFYSGEDFHQYILENSMIFDIVFLDIELPGKNGIDIGNIIRNSFMNHITKIIFVSNYESYWREAFQVHPFFFIVKPPGYSEVEKIIEDILNVIFIQNGTFSYTANQKEYEIELYKVLYFIQNKRKIIIKTFKDNLEHDSFYGKISDIKEQLLKSDFFLTNKFCLVNYHAVLEFGYEEIKLVNGEIFNIIQPFRKDVRAIHIKRKRAH